MFKKKEEKSIIKNSLGKLGLEKLDTLNKLRLVVVSIFALSTLSIILVFVTDFWVSATLILISYILVFVLMVKLLIIKKL